MESKLDLVIKELTEIRKDNSTFLTRFDSLASEVKAQAVANEKRFASLETAMQELQRAQNAYPPLLSTTPSTAASSARTPLASSAQKRFRSSGPEDSSGTRRVLFESRSFGSLVPNHSNEAMDVDEPEKVILSAYGFNEDWDRNQYVQWFALFCKAFEIPEGTKVYIRTVKKFADNVQIVVEDRELGKSILQRSRTNPFLLEAGVKLGVAKYGRNKVVEIYRKKALTVLYKNADKYGCGQGSFSICWKSGEVYVDRVCVGFVFVSHDKDDRNKYEITIKKSRNCPSTFLFDHYLADYRAFCCL